MTTKSISNALAEFRARLPNQARLYVAGGTAEPMAAATAFARAPDLAAGVTFVGVWIPGINMTDWAALHPTARAETTFMSPAVRPSFDNGHSRLLPLRYTQSASWLATTPLDAGIIMVSPPDESGLVSLGVSVDFSPLILAREEVPLLGLINPSLKATVYGPKIPLERFEMIAEADLSLVQINDPALPETFDRIGKHIAGLCAAGDTIQFGLGNVQQAALKALTNHQRLRVHAGMISTPLIGLLDSGAIESDYGAVTTGIAIGTDELYTRACQDDRILFAPVTYTHALSTLAEIPNLKAINSCIEVDLFGQANAEFIRGRQISGTGGLVDFLRGAALSKGGRGILALASTTKNGSISRIVPRLPADATSVSRADVDTVITEHGIAELKYKSIDARAAALIEIADPAFREQLAKDWHEMRRGL